MKSKQIAFGLALLAVIISGAMYIIGGESGHLTELRDFFWAPLPLAVLCFLIGMKSKG